jgi:hypothetical protein
MKRRAGISNALGCRLRAGSVKAAGTFRVPSVFPFRFVSDDGTLSVPATQSHGLTLFEVVIALAIFMGAIAAIGQLISVGARGAVSAQLQSQAVIRAETTLGEVLAGYISLRTTSGTFPDNPAWTWSVTVSSAQQQGLYLVEVTAAHAGKSSMSKSSYTVRRLLRDPAVAVQAYEYQLALEQSKANSSSTSSSSSSGGSK